MPRRTCVIVAGLSVAWALPAVAHAGSVRVVTGADGVPRAIFTGGSEANDVSLSRSIPSDVSQPMEFRFFDRHDISAGTGCETLGSAAICRIAGRRGTAEARLGGGDDLGRDGGFGFLIDGQGGSDTLDGRLLAGGPGADDLQGTTSGDQFYVAPGDGTDRIDGLDGFDSLTIEQPGTLDMRGDTDELISIENLSGTGGDDVLIGNDRPGGWSMSGGNGNDRLVAGAVASSLDGGNGDDVLVGGAGADSLSGNNDDDQLEGGGGADRLDGQNGNDDLRSADGVRDTVNCGNGNDRIRVDALDAVNADCELADRDGDALADDWETDGFDADGDGTPELDLAAMGASPDHKDIFVEIDYMPPHALENEAIGWVIDAFANAPVTNPDGVSGITLHVDNGPGSVMNPDSGETWGALSDQDVVPHQQFFGSTGSDGRYDWAAFDAVKATSFLSYRRRAFHYALSVHDLGGLFVGGLSRGLPASDFLVSLGATDANGADVTHDVRDQAQTFMHELGHGLGLRHGGTDHVQYKPNYLSIMNYAFGGWLWKEDGTSTLDFSRFEVPFDEASLDETTGFGFDAGELASFISFSYCPDGATSKLRPLRARFTDWDCSGTDDGVVAVDANGDTAISVLQSQTDWDKLVFDGGVVGADLDDDLPATTVVDEPTEAEVRANAERFESALAPNLTPAPTPSPAPAGGTTPPPALPAQAAPRADPARLGRLKLAPARFRPLRRGPSVVKRGGAKVSYRLDRAASVRFTVQRVAGRRLRPVPGRFEHRGRAGTNTLRFSGRLAGKALRPGRYRLTATVAGRGTSAAFAIRR